MWPRIGRRAIGPDARVFAVAELGNQGGDLQQAIALVDAAAHAGASERAS
jgi:sialic acid synthase SpsE